MPEQENPDLPKEKENLPEVPPFVENAIVSPSPQVVLPEQKQITGIKKPKVPNPGKRKNNGNLL